MNKDAFINAVLIPKMYDTAETLFDGFNFEKRGNMKAAYLRHIDGETQEGGGKGNNVIIYANRPHNVIEVGGHSLEGQKNCEIVKWYAFLNNITRGEAIRQLSEKLGCTREYKETYARGYEEEDPEELQRRTDLYIAQQCMVETLNNKEHHTGATALAFMLERGWTVDEIESANIGAYDGKDVAANNTIPGEVRERWNKFIGSTHTIAVPMCVNGRLERFAFRASAKVEGDKYMNETGEKKYLFGNIGSCCIIVEGVLDYVHALVNGVRNVLCTCGRPSHEQVQYIAKYQSVKTVVLLFDNDNAGREHTRLFATALRNTDKKVVIAAVPAGADGTQCKDIDDFLTAATRAGWTDAQKQRAVDDMVKSAVPFDNWRAAALECSFAEAVLNEGNNAKEKVKIAEVDDAMVRQVVNAVKGDVEKRTHFEEGVRKMFAELTPSCVERSAELLEKWHIKDDNNKTFVNIEALMVEGISEARKTAKEKEGGGAVAKNGVSADGKVIDCTPLENDLSMDGALEEIHDVLEAGVPSMFAFTNDSAQRPLYITWLPGLSLLCANTGHGKTSILNGVALYDAKRNEVLNNGKVTLYFSYEMSRGELLLDMFKLYNGDAYLSNNSERTFYDYFEKQQYKEDVRLQCRYFKREQYDPSQSFAETEQAKEAVANSKQTHFEHFTASFNEFFGRMIAPGGTLRIIQENYTIEQLVDVIDMYIDKVQRQEQKEISLICIDYAQLLYSTTKASQQRFDEIKWVIEKLSIRAQKQWRVPVVMPAQFNQTVIHPGKLHITAIGEAGAFSRFANTVIGFFNLKAIPETPGKDDYAAIKAILESAGLGMSNYNNGKFQSFEGFMYARLLKRRRGGTEYRTVLRWQGELKKVYGNVNMYVADKDFAEAVGITMEEGRKRLKVLAENMKYKASTYNIQVTENDKVVQVLRKKYIDLEDEDEREAEAMKHPNLYDEQQEQEQQQPPQQTDDSTAAPGGAGRDVFDEYNDLAAKGKADELQQ